MLAEIITIGDEILIGQVIDSNSAWLAGRLNEVGITVGQITSIGDDPAVLENALEEASRRADIIIMTGGLGPTKDDRTKQTLCGYFGGKLVLHEKVLENVKTIFSRSNRPLLDSNMRQAEVPDNCRVLLNSQGTAPGMWFEKEGRVYISLPGVPFEMMGLAGEQVIPMLKEYFRDRLEPVLHKTLVTTGIGESFLAELVAPAENFLPPYIHLAYLPRPGMVRLRLSAYGKELTASGNKPAEGIVSALQLEKELDIHASRIMELAEKYVIATEDTPVPEIILNRLRERGRTLATAESCTGGYIAHLITAIPGASDVFSGSVVAYSNKIKSSLLGVNDITLTHFGAVSRETVSEMAAGAIERLGVDYAIACSGIMGPGGGSADKPVGTVWIAVADKEHVQAEKFSFSGRRPQLIERTAIAALGMLFHFVE
ncbi:nicotinamide-nucleotide amidase [Anseongella ginsenosidimutans]|uniref:CinA-like protein n=1 Tax=Anseongella ginsenosidimutans TaxID=496056 RepID=A0A4R3KNH0_9SPHI|nr:CinA family nicotinamide mononucleotide deamidase-related protein [Anseongella ginsenosidimutans]QEC53685.1 CinA family nicotinamide mononucleotide deamidase-related protein [Anseongella ginsenosidimutans]TCS86065.1 nicotinamide-nucleotide amidase [Anseongella ginsenosidimutans]